MHGELVRAKVYEVDGLERCNDRIQRAAEQIEQRVFSMFPVATTSSFAGCPVSGWLSRKSLSFATTTRLSASASSVIWRPVERLPSVSWLVWIALWPAASRAPTSRAGVARR